MIGRIGRAFGKTPLQQALEYGRVSQDFFDSLSPDRRILVDHHILNRLIQAENEAQEKATKTAKENRDHPGMERYHSEDDFWAEVEEAEKESQA
jgi:TRAP-type C4-dicarboxylate transport system substrate-binding protein